jgi:hypothetical protein
LEAAGSGVRGANGFVDAGGETFGANGFGLPPVAGFSSAGGAGFGANGFTAGCAGSDLTICTATVGNDTPAPVEDCPTARQHATSKNESRRIVALLHQRNATPGPQPETSTPERHDAAGPRKVPTFLDRI